MPIDLKTSRQIDLMRQAGKLARHVISTMKKAVAPGVTTAELDEIARIEIEKAGAWSPVKNYPDYKPNQGFPGYTCVSVNDEVVHGIPGPRVLQEGDIVKVDCALSLNGYIGDTATTIPVGNVDPKVQKLLDVTRETLQMAIDAIRPEKKWSDVARLIQHHVEQRHKYSMVREFVGHGVGRSMHEDPKVPNFVTAEQLRGDFRLKVGMTLAVEPMVAMGKRHVKMLEDGWTVVTKDGLPAAHFEHTIAVTENGAEVLTDGSE